jgi:SAM-dependent methyltransferase
MKWALDCACGANHLKAEGYRIVGVDIAYSCCDVATKPDVLCDAHHLPFRDDVFDLVFSSHTLEHVRTPYEILKEFKRVGKRLIVRVPNIGYYRGSINEDNDHLHCWNSQCFRQLLSLVYGHVKVRQRFDWTVRGYSAGKGVFFRQIAIVKKIFFVLMMGEYSELEAVCFS